MSRCTALLAFLLVSAGCGGVEVEDSIRTRLFRLSLFPEDSLHSPYVTGASFTVKAWHTDGDVDHSGWRIASDDPRILRFEEVEATRSQVKAIARAGEPGFTRIRIEDARGRLLRAPIVEVAAPDRVELFSHARLLIGDSLREARVDEARILRRGTATYHVRYYQGRRALAGNGALAVDPVDGVIAQPRRTFFLEDQEWLSLTATSTGERRLRLRAGAFLAGELAFAGLGEADVDRVAIEGEDESRASAKDWLRAVAYGLDREQRPIYGISFDWRLDGRTEGPMRPLPWESDGEAPPTWDLFEYEFLPGSTKTLTASFGGHMATAIIHAGQGFVSSTNRLGCSTAPGPAGAGSLLCAALAVLLLRLRRAGPERPARGQTAPARPK